MKFHADKPESHTITAHGPGWVAIDGERHTQSLLLSSFGQLLPWECADFDALTAAHFSRLIEIDPTPPELVVFGSGTRLRFPHPALTQALIQARIGIETMDTPAACRTYNILAGEGRRVVVALLIGDR